MKSLKKIILTFGIFMFILSSCKFSNENQTSTLAEDASDSASGTTSEGLSSIVNTRYSSNAGAIWNCHDPKLFQDDDGTYYVYSTGWAAGVQTRTSSDLISWTRKAASPFYSSKTISSKQYPHMYWDDDFLKWVGYAKNDGTKYTNSYYTSTTSPNSWAPTVIKQNGKYYMFHGIITDSLVTANRVRPAACITLAISDSPTGPFIPASTYDAESYSQSSLVRYVWTNDSDALQSDSEIGYEGCYNSASGSWSYGFGCIDPEFVIDVATGDLCEYTIGSNTCYAMTYGSWKGGISLIYVDAESLKPVCTSAGTSSFDGKTYAVGDEMDAPLDSISGNSGKLIAGGYGAAYEGAQVIYNSDTGYYYVFVSMGDLTYEYRVGVGRASEIEGEYFDAGGQSMLLSSSNAGQYHAIGSKIIGAFSFKNEYGFRCPGGQSIFRDKDGRILLSNHTRTNYLNTGNFALQIHQMFFNEDGWPLLNMNDYYDEDTELESISLADLAGTYEAILTVRGYDRAVFNSTDGQTENAYCIADANDTASKTIVIDESGNISGNYSGSLLLDEEAGHIVISLTDLSGNALGTFKGIIMEAVDWYRKGSSAKRKTLTFSTLDSNSSDAAAGEYFFANRTSTSTEAVDVDYADYIVAADSSYSESTGISISFNLDDGLSSDWDAFIASSQTVINLATMEYWPAGEWTANIYESAATAGSAATSEAYKTYYNDAAFVSISFNTDGSIVFYKDGQRALSYSADTLFSNPEDTSVKVSDICLAFISDAASEGFTFMPSSKIETGAFSVTSLKIDSALDDESAASLYGLYQ
ncbi:MAG: glycoside hydrolase family 43 protein [Treponema sp.]|nr:glycoside hydrolase family 43 protein [Treponema sp.]